MKYTESSDGKMRATLRVPIRLTADQIKDLEQLAEEQDDTDLRSMLSSWLDLAIEGNMADMPKEEDE